MLINALVLEDSRTQLRIISQMMMQAGWNVFEAMDVQAAFKILLSQRIDLILMDVFLGAEDSLRYIDNFRHAASQAQIAVMTAGGRMGRVVTIEQALESARKAKADYLLAKPFTQKQIGDMFGQVQQTMSRRRQVSRILVIEDSATVRMMISNALKSEGHVVHEARTMEDAISRIDILRVELVVADIFLPGMGGMAGIARIRKTWPDVKILAISAGLERKWEASTVLDQAIAAGADSALQKPFSAVQVVGAVAKMSSGLREPEGLADDLLDVIEI